MDSNGSAPTGKARQGTATRRVAAHGKATLGTALRGKDFERNNTMKSFTNSLTLFDRQVIWGVAA